MNGASFFAGMNMFILVEATIVFFAALEMLQPIF
jgi:hypothetical protein